MLCKQMQMHKALHSTFYYSVFVGQTERPAYRDGDKYLPQPNTLTQITISGQLLVILLWIFMVSLEYMLKVLMTSNSTASSESQKQNKKLW